MTHLRRPMQVLAGRTAVPAIFEAKARDQFQQLDPFWMLVDLAQQPRRHVQLSPQEPNPLGMDRNSFTWL